MTLTAPSKDSGENATLSFFSDFGNSSNSSSHHEISKEVMGYIALFGNTFCMVSSTSRLEQNLVIFLLFTGDIRSHPKEVHLQQAKKYLFLFFVC